MEDAVFAQSFIPRKLEEVAHYERDREALAAGKKVLWSCVGLGMNLNVNFSLINAALSFTPLRTPLPTHSLTSVKQT